jgi:hypothetical protein
MVTIQTLGLKMGLAERTPFSHDPKNALPIFAEDMQKIIYQ